MARGRERARATFLGCHAGADSLSTSHIDSGSHSTQARQSRIELCWRSCPHPPCKRAHPPWRPARSQLGPWLGRRGCMAAGEPWPVRRNRVRARCFTACANKPRKYRARARLPRGTPATSIIAIIRWVPGAEFGQQVAQQVGHLRPTSTKAWPTFGTNRPTCANAKGWPSWVEFGRTLASRPKIRQKECQN